MYPRCPLKGPSSWITEETRYFCGKFRPRSSHKDSSRARFLISIILHDWSVVCFNHYGKKCEDGRRQEGTGEFSVSRNLTFSDAMVCSHQIARAWDRNISWDIGIISVPDCYRFAGPESSLDTHVENYGSLSCDPVRISPFVLEDLAAMIIKRYNLDCGH